MWLFPLDAEGKDLSKNFSTQRPPVRRKVVLVLALTVFIFFLPWTIISNSEFFSVIEKSFCIKRKIFYFII